MGKFKVGQWVRVKHTDYKEEFPVGSVFKVGRAYGHGVEPEGEHKELFFLDWELEPWHPKVGERVRFVEKYGTAVAGDEGTVIGFWEGGIEVDVRGTMHSCYARRVAPTFIAPAASPVAEQPAPLKIEAGRYYRTRDGRKVGPMRDDGNGLFGADGFNHKEWYDNGRCYTDLSRTHPKDLIAEWVDEPAKASNDNAAPAKPKLKVGDRVTQRGWRDVHVSTIVSITDTGITIVDDSGNRGSYSLSAPFVLAAPVTTTNPAIVCLIENGQPKPADRPFVHPDQAAAARESKRLAGVHKGKEFGVYVLTSTAKEERTYDYEWQRLAAKGEKIAAIRELRVLAGLTLRGAKDAVEAWVSYQAAA